MPSKSKAQQKFMGMVHALQKGDMKPSDASPELKKVANRMDKTDVKDYASTSHKGLPKKVKQEIVKKLKELNESVKQSDYISGLKDLQKAVKSEKGSFQGNNGGNVAKLYYEKALKMGMDNKFIDNLTRKRINAYNKKAFSLSGGSLHTAVVGGIDLLLKNINEYANKMGTNTMGGDSIPSAKKGGLRDFDGYDNVDYNKDMPMDEVSSADVYSISRMLGTGQQSTQDFIEDNKIDVKKLESYIKKLSPSKKIIIKDIINGSTDKRLSTIKKGLIKQVKESLDESHYTAIANLGTKKAKENLDSFDELQKFMDKMKSRKAISVQVTKINGGKKQTINYDWDGRNWVSKNKKGVQENFPSNWLQGRVSDYHTKKGTTPRDAYDKTNFNTKHSGQEDLEDGELEESGKDKSEKNYKAWKSSRIKKEIVRKLREWGSNLDNSYILDKDSILKGTPEDKDAIKREDIVDQSFNKAKVVDEACWKGYKQVGGKIKNGKQVPNCVPESVDNEIDETAKRDYKAEYKKFQSSTKAKKYRAELNKYNRQKGTYGNGDGKDASHKGGKIVGFETESKNRGRREKSRLKKK